MDAPAKTKFFTASLLAWHRRNPRPMPWSETRNPYLIWLSEIILQQTRVSQGWSYYEKFARHYPTVHDLASASEAQVLKDWQGLGYNSRARNLHATARYISESLDGKFPETYDALLALKGIGPYTAAAIGSFAFELPHPVVDGNVKRVIARYDGIRQPVDQQSTHRMIRDRAFALMGKHKPSIFNQAIMNFGALLCTPQTPDCSSCQLNQECAAYQNGQVGQIPVKSPKKARRRRCFHYFVLRWQGQLVLRKRIEQDIWQQMYDFPLLENTSRRSLSIRAREAFLSRLKILNATRTSPPVQLRQLLTHQHIHATFYSFDLGDKPDLSTPGWYLADRKNLSNFAFPKIIAQYLDEQWRPNW